ncbi:MAG TPA: hypothetical protein VNQ90_16080 [Chthoniobacteraceae bacterium]|nr:hypothetical protein [Chthoniobacteraceae bacterium]
MCVIAGYIGTQPAAPLLLEMLRREEGLAGGYYTGIVTLHEGRLHHAKVVGDVETLIATTDAWKLPGTIGLAHSRTPGGGGHGFAHPFLDHHQKLAYIANGSNGLYNGKVDFAAAAEVLLQNGYSFSSASPEKITKYPVLADGRCIHYSDLLCQDMAWRYENLPPSPDRLLKAISATYQHLPGEIVGLCLHADGPDEIAGARHNKPMEIGKLPDGSYVLASSTLAFPGEARHHLRMPGLSAIRIHREEGIQISPFENKKLLPLGLPPSALAVEEKVVHFLRQEKQVWVPMLREHASASLWKEHELGEPESVVFPLLAALLKEGRINLQNEYVPGVKGHGLVPRMTAHWVDAKPPHGRSSAKGRRQSLENQ